MEDGKKLYRSKALAFVGAGSFGSIEILQPISFRLITVGFFIMMLAVIVFLFVGKYARTQVVSGFVEPKEGVVQVNASVSGLAQEVLVEEGSFVEKDQSLVVLSGGRTLYGGAEENTQVLELALAQKKRILEDIELARSRHHLDMQWDMKNEEGILEGISQLEEIANMQEDRTEIYLENYEAFLSLRDNSFVSESDERSARSRLLSEQQTLLNLRQQLSNMNRELEHTRYLISSHAVNLSREISVLENELSELEKEITRLQSQSLYVIKAPISGRVTALTVKKGNLIAAGMLTMNILPENSDLHAVLIIPSNAAGFLETGQKVMLKYDSFPYQKFGAQEAVISLVSEASISANEQIGSITTTQPSFIVYADLDSPKIQAYGEDRDIQPGMLLSADIVVEERTLMEWILEPFYTLRGRVG
ncbi:MAG: HlyD family efflux transporter periplasmic adaptor subunit [Gammaproteobacteria bacterium]|nr:HlyD family efflux transporter periplasmic adaptor subunit [Gammaproteobacteria bacterium]